ncbi:MAG: hypothetical protein LC632_08370 [Xanthomonadaceae bacterium]|nr:hypothetical protein [Xanthomonadaceae bacterium]
MRNKKTSGMAVAALVLSASLAGCAGMPNATESAPAPKIASELEMGSTSRVTVIARDELAQGHSFQDALRLHPAVDVTGR